MSEHATPSDTPSGQATGVQSVAAALDLLDCLATEPELGVTELGRRSESQEHRAPHPDDPEREGVSSSGCRRPGAYRLGIGCTSSAR